MRGLQIDSTTLLLHQCLDELAKLDLIPERGESLERFCERASSAIPSLSEWLNELANAYQNNRFNNETSKISTLSLEKDIKRCLREIRLYRHGQPPSRTRTQTNSSKCN